MSFRSKTQLYLIGQAHFVSNYIAIFRSRLCIGLIVIDYELFTILYNSCIRSFIVRLMSDNQQGQQPQGKEKRIKKDEQRYKRKRTATEQAQKDGKMLFPCQFCPPHDRKVYQSYSALYFHVKNKHPEEKITSAKHKPPKFEDSNPILKLKTILKGSQKQREDIQRELIDIKSLLCLKLSQLFLQKKSVQFNQIGEQRSQQYMDAVSEQALKLSKQLKFKEEVFKKAQTGCIFRYYYTKIAPISFGKDLVRYFAKNIKISSKIYCQMILMQSLDQLLLDLHEFTYFQSLIWREIPSAVKHIKQQWIKWKSINKQLVTKSYSQLI